MEVGGAGPRRPLAVITDDRFGESAIEQAILGAAGVELVVAKCRSSAEVAAAGREADALLVNLAPADAAAIEALERCRVIARYGIGLDNVDQEAARRRGIRVANVPGYCDTEVAEHALALILALSRGIARRDRVVRGGGWGGTPFGRRIAGTTLGILGFGGTGQALARIALALSFREILVWSPHISAGRIAEALGPAPAALGAVVRPAGFEELLSRSDWVSVHLPLKGETRGIVGASAMAMMKKEACLVNVSRGAVLDEEALIDAMATGALAGVGLDVFVAEPLPQGNRLRSFPNAVFTDHNAYASTESIAELRRRTAENALAGLAAAGLVPSGPGLPR
ncbi:MAG TPA: C-terminal binding protein [Rectinemataceae bacterium]|nr:C-terminal binding protein [Rectinemataceae bacterium]